MSNNGHGATASEWLMLILLTVVKGFLLIILVLEYRVISKLMIDHSLFEVLFKYFFFASETLIAIGTLAAIFRLLFVRNQTNTSRRFPPHLPWWCGR